MAASRLLEANVLTQGNACEVEGLTGRFRGASRKRHQHCTASESCREVLTTPPELRFLDSCRLQNLLSFFPHKSLAKNAYYLLRETRQDLTVYAPLSHCQSAERALVPRVALKQVRHVLRPKLLGVLQHLRSQGQHHRIIPISQAAKPDRRHADNFPLELRSKQAKKNLQASILAAWLRLTVKIHRKHPKKGQTHLAERKDRRGTPREFYFLLFTSTVLPLVEVQGGGVLRSLIGRGSPLTKTVWMSLKATQHVYIYIYIYRRDRCILLGPHSVCYSCPAPRICLIPQSADALAATFLPVDDIGKALRRKLCRLPFDASCQSSKQDASSLVV